MKKFWKNLCVCSMAVVSAMSLWACGKPAPEVSVDLDGDGVISAWETIFDAKESSDRQINNSAEVVEIADLAGLKAINDKTSETKIYKLVKNINCNGETLSINLGSSILLGNNNVIKNFKFGDCIYKFSAESENALPVNVKGLFYNGVAIYDLRVFVGNQTIDLNNTYSQSIVSTFVNVSNIENIEVRGKLAVNRQKTDGLGSNSVDVSLLNSNINELKLSESLDKGLSIRKSTVVGKIVYTEAETSSLVRIGGVIPHNAQGGLIYNVNSSVDIEANSSGKIFMGGIAGESDDFISSCSTSGEMKLTYTPNFESKVGGIVGSNNKTGEIKNSSTSVNINFNKDIVTSSMPLLYIGGIAGCNYGVMTYVTTDANMTINNAVQCRIGGVAGYSENAIISNVISRGNINCNNVGILYASEMIGISKGGYYESAVVTTNVNVNNSDINSTVYLGMLTMFEDFQIDAMYNAEFAPYVTGILLGSKNAVYMKPATSNSNSNEFVYNLGLRNPFEYVVIDENTGEPKTEIRVDQYGNPVIDEETGNEIIDIVTATLVPDVYSKLFYTSGYGVTKYNVSNGINTTESLTFTYAKDNSNASIVSECSDSRLIVNFFVRNLGFKYGLNHSEIDLKNLSLDKIKFTLSESEHLNKYFEKKSYNGELIYFDRFLENECTFDSTDEMFSLLHNLILSDNVNSFIPLKVSKEFVNSILESEEDSEEVIEDESSTLNESPNQEESESGVQEDEYIDLSLDVEHRFAISIQRIIKNMFGVTPNLTLLTADKVNVQDVPSDVYAETKYIRLTFTTSEFSYQFTFNVSQMVADEDGIEDNYIVYLHYYKASNGMS